MHDMKKYRLLTIVLFISLIIVLIILSIYIWNSTLKEEFVYNKSIIIICIVLILIISVLKFNISYKLSDKSKVDQKIKEIVEKEKAKIIAELDKKEIHEEKTSETEVNVDKIVKKIIPNIQNLKTLKSYSEKVMSNIAKEIEIVQGLFYTKAKKTNLYKLAGEYAFTGDEKPKDFKLGITLPGQAAKNKDLLIINEIPDEYYPAESGLGKSMPKNLIMVPIINKNTSIAVMELGTFKEISSAEQKVLKDLSLKLGDKIDKFIK
ncbi:MAG: GAF domain-containing protein [Bacteroidales bacterium]|nr:MAG: GAF domain-containing protein [Bacteroidales bacterium]